MTLLHVSETVMMIHLQYPILSIAEAKAAAEKAQASKLLISFEFGKTLEKHTQNLY